MIIIWRLYDTVFNVFYDTLNLSYDTTYLIFFLLEIWKKNLVWYLIDNNQF